jgi:hypothetical protein
MNTDDLNLAYKVRHALNEHLDNLPASTADRLASARKLAAIRARNPIALRCSQRGLAIAGNIGSFFSFSSWAAWACWCRCWRW